jgi:membrane protein DedA with SNARE-associated domain
VLHSVQNWLSSLPPGYLYLLVAVLIATESMGVPLPGEIALVSAALLASSGYASIGWVIVAGCLGAIIGDSIGYLIGHWGGRPFLQRLGRRFPKHLGPTQLQRAERIFQRYGVWAIFFGRFVALLRVLAGPLSGALRIPWRKFVMANAAGGIVWAGGTALAVYFVGKAAEQWLSRFSWIALIVAVVAGLVTTLIIRNRMAHSSPSQAELQAAAEPADAPPHK